LELLDGHKCDHRFVVWVDENAIAVILLIDFLKCDDFGF